MFYTKYCWLNIECRVWCWRLTHVAGEYHPGPAQPCIVGFQHIVKAELSLTTSMLDGCIPLSHNDARGPLHCGIQLWKGRRLHIELSIRSGGSIWYHVCELEPPQYCWETAIMWSQYWNGQLTLVTIARCECLNYWFINSFVY